MRLTPGLLAVVFAAAAPAQTISGRVYDETAAVVTGARVVLLQEFNKISETKSDEKGEFAFTGLAAGAYQVQVKQPMFGIFQQLVRVEEGRKPFVRAVIHVARAESGIGISSSAPPGTGAMSGAVKFRTGGRVEGIKRLSGRMPAFPEQAAARGAQGAVVLYGTVKADGTVADITTLESPDHDLEAAAVEAWKTWKYQPMKLNGQPVDCRELYVFQFELR